MLRNDLLLCAHQFSAVNVFPREPAEKRKRPGSISNEPGRPDLRVTRQSISRRRGRNHLARRFSSLVAVIQSSLTASQTRPTVVAQVAVSIADRDRSTISTARGIRLELRKLLIAVSG